MFNHKLSEHAELRLLEERHAEELSDLTNRIRDHLRAWLPWVARSRTLEDRKNFIRRSLEQFAENNGFQAGIWYDGRLAGVVGFGLSTRRRAAPGRVALRPLRRSRGLRHAFERVAQTFLAFLVLSRTGLKAIGAVAQTVFVTG